jgi:citrate lyase beta subunit
MRHNSHNSDFKFYKDPLSFTKFTDKSFLQFCLGGTLYMPGTKSIFFKIKSKSLPSLTSMVMCFEDSIMEDEVPNAEVNVLSQLLLLHDELKFGSLSYDEIPLIFLRVRSIDQFKRFTSKLTTEHINVLTGFVFPKFSSENSLEYLNILGSLNVKFGVTLYAMPILEGKLIAYRETRIRELNLLSNHISDFSDIILNIRVGGTDFSSVFGVRRGMSYSIYDILTVRDCLSDILNYFSRDICNYTISAPVWEYFLTSSFNQKKFDNLDDIYFSSLKRSKIINPAIDGLLREIVIDKANGFVGKTIIHPSHLIYVNALQAITSEEYNDAMQILSTPGGVIKSNNFNKMNEINPHTSWAKKIIQIGNAYGVVDDYYSYFKILNLQHE